MEHGFLDRFSDRESPVHSVDPRVKVVCAVVYMLLVVSTPPAVYQAFFIHLAVLLLVGGLSRVPMTYILRRSMTVVPFVLMVAIFLPFQPADSGGSISLGFSTITLSHKGLLVFWNVLAKGFLGILVVIILSSTTPFPRLLQAMGSLRFPNLFIVLLGFTYRFLFVLVDEAMRMKRARDSRLFGGKWIWRVRVVGNMIGTLFIRSYERGERVYQAMLSRGFDGRSPFPPLGGLRAGDLFPGALFIAAGILARMSSAIL